MRLMICKKANPNGPCKYDSECPHNYPHEYISWGSDKIRFSDDDITEYVSEFCIEKCKFVANNRNKCKPYKPIKAKAGARRKTSTDKFIAKLGSQFRLASVEEE